MNLVVDNLVLETSFGKGLVYEKGLLEIYSDVCSLCKVSFLAKFKQLIQILVLLHQELGHKLSHLDELLLISPEDEQDQSSFVADFISFVLIAIVRTWKRFVLL